MNQLTVQQIISQYPFLDERTAQEPYIIDILDELSRKQRECLNNPEFTCATMEFLQQTNTVKIPYTTARNKNIEYIIETLLSKYPEIIRTVKSFDFVVDSKANQLEIKEILEYTISLKDHQYQELMADRDNKSHNNLMKLIIQYKVFNLSRLLKSTTAKEELSRIVKLGLGKNIFTFKHHTIDRNQIEWAEDFCFHAQNYNTVKQSLNLNKLKELIQQHHELVLRRLKKFGIINADFGDYRDSKLDYIFSVFNDDLGSSIPEKDLIEVKNIQALRTCLLKVDKLLDNSQTSNSDIVNFVKQNGISQEIEVKNSLVNVTAEALSKWCSSDMPRSEGILIFTLNGNRYLVDQNAIIQLFNQKSSMLVNSKLEGLTIIEKERFSEKVEVLYQLTQKFLEGNSNLLEESVAFELDELIKKYEYFIKKQSQPAVQTTAPRAMPAKAIKPSILERIGDAIRSLFGGRKKKKAYSSTSSAAEAGQLNREIRQVYKKIISRREPLLALSDFIDLSRDNDPDIDQLIEQLREEKLKVVIPVYNSRESLYPKLSQKILLSDVEYLMVDFDVIKNPDIIREFIDSLVGFELKGEPVPGKALLMVEKYLLTINRQKRASMLKKEL